MNCSLLAVEFDHTLFSFKVDASILPDHLNRCVIPLLPNEWVATPNIGQAALLGRKPEQQTHQNAKVLYPPDPFQLVHELSCVQYTKWTISDAVWMKLWKVCYVILRWYSDAVFFFDGLSTASPLVSRNAVCFKNPSFDRTFPKIIRISLPPGLPACKQMILTQCHHATKVSIQRP